MHTEFNGESSKFTEAKHSLKLKLFIKTQLYVICVHIKLVRIISYIVTCIGRVTAWVFAYPVTQL